MALATLIFSCGQKKEEKKEGVAIDLSNKGVGPIKAVAFGEVINTEMASKGEEMFKAICSACHMANQRMIGPALSGVYERRSPEWVMNMIINPGVMIQEDPSAKALFKEYNDVNMLNQNLNEDEVRALAEYLRTL